MNKQLASDLGFLGINVDSNFDLAWLKTEVANKIREGDITSIYKLINFARHSEDKAIRDYANIIANVYADKVEAYSQFPSDVKGKQKEEEPVEIVEAETVEDIANAFNTESDSINVEIANDLSVAEGTTFIVGAGKKATVKVDGDVSCVSNVFSVEDGGELVLEGTGTISSSSKKTNSVISADGANAKVVVDGVTIDTITTSGKTNNNAYGIYLLNDASLEIKSGVIKTAYGSCIGTNNTTGGNTDIIISGGELYSDGSYAIYLPAQGTVTITGGKVQGINARMGTFNIGGNAEIIPTTIDANGYDDIGAEFKTSGCVWLGDTIAVMAGTYTDTDGTDCVFNIGGNATVTSNFRSAVGIYKVDTKQAQNVTVNIEDASKVTTTAEGFDNTMVYDHDYISEAATAKGKTYGAVANSNVVINVAGAQVYPVPAA